MSQTVETAYPPVSPEEMARRIAEYRRMSYERRAPAVMVYAPPRDACPWPDCQTRIVGLQFDLEGLGAAADVERWQRWWWQGPGLVARCPGCDRHVLFGYEVKQAIADVSRYQEALLPDHWYDRSHVAPRPKPKYDTRS